MSNYLSKLNGVKTIADALLILMAHPEALNYDAEMLRKQFNDTTELKRLALYLCGTSGETMAIMFMTGYKLFPDEFFTNVSFNSDESLPMVVRAINLALEHEAYMDK